MEEVDNIIIHTLRQIGCNLNESVSSLKEFTTDNVIEATSTCLRVINDANQFSRTLPPSMSARFRLGTGLAQACQGLGFNGVIGYQTFLYPTEGDIRTLFMFLVERLPKETAEAADEPMGGAILLNRRIASELSKILAGTWIPPFCKRSGIRWVGKDGKTWQREGVKGVHPFRSSHLKYPKGLGDLTRKVPKDVKQYYDSPAMPLITSQPCAKHNIPDSVLEANSLKVSRDMEWENEWNHSGLASGLTPEEYKAKKQERLLKKLSKNIQAEVQKATVEGSKLSKQDFNEMIREISERNVGAGQENVGSRFTRSEKLQFTQDEEKELAAVAAIAENGGPKIDTEEELQARRKEEIDAMQGRLTELTSRLEGLEIDMKKFTATIQQAQEETELLQRKNKEEEDAYKVKKRTADLLPDASNNIAKLETVVENSSARLVTLAKQWEEHRKPLIEQYREMKALNSTRLSEAQKKIDEIRSLREKMKETVEEVRNRDELLKDLVTEYQNMVKDVNRSAYTKRILEIVANIKKQKNDIDKILVDTRSVQKDINQLSGKLSRTFKVTDELIFKDAKKDEACRKAYRYLASLHENCEELVKCVEETGVIMREIRDLEEQIDVENEKDTASNLEKITKDYKIMKEENAGLVKKLKSRS